jgi:hypothetical protein
MSSQVVTLEQAGDANLSGLELDRVIVARPQRAGLANRLFPWARAVVHSTLAHIPMLPTRWLQLKIGPLVRGERDRRLYAGLFDREPWAINRTLGHALGGRRLLPEPSDLSTPGHSPYRRSVIVFSGVSDYFERLVQHRALVRDRLRVISRFGIPPIDRPPPVIAHVRRGDLAAKWRTPDEWYLAAARLLRCCGYDREVGIVSDGTDAELRPLLDEGFILIRGRNALEDLWTLSSANVLLGSGVSTFSSWATYLGDGLLLAPDHLDCTGLDRLLSTRVRLIGVNDRRGDVARLVIQRLGQ